MKRAFLFAMSILFITSATQATPPVGDVFYTVLAGGGGTRLWPLSRDSKPKQFLEVGSNRTLLEQTFDRLSLCHGFSGSHLVIATAPNLETQMRETVRHVTVDTKIISDPSRRDTGPAILLNVLEVLKENPNAVVAFVPADPFIPSQQSGAFSSAIDEAVSYVHDHPNKIVLLGKTPTFPATGYGYIEMADSQDKVFNVSSFKEKPTAEIAKELVSSGRYLWNMGIFVAKAEFFADLFKRYAPDVYLAVTKYVKERNPSDYSAAKLISVDFAVMQPAAVDKHLLVLPVTFDWEDVGDVKTYLETHIPHLNQVGTAPAVYEHADAQGNLVYAQKGKLVTLAGVSGLCVVDTPDSLLIIPCNQAQKVKDVVKALQANPIFRPYTE
jgi:mannose-1-phosphate guanylyltransferase